MADTRMRHLRAITAITRRDTSIYFSYPLQPVIRLAQLLFATATLYFISKLVHGAPELDQYGGDYFSFALSGIIVISFVTLGLTAFASTLTDEQRNGTLETLLSYPIDPVTLMIGSLITPLWITVVTDAVLVTIAALGMGFSLSVSAVLTMLPLLVLTAAVFGSVGVLSATFVMLAKRGDPITTLAGQLSAFFAGAIFPIALLPAWSQGVAKLVPTYYALDGVRESLQTDGSSSAIAGDLLVLAIASAVLLPLSFVAYRAAVTASARAGTIGTY